MPVSPSCIDTGVLGTIDAGVLGAIEYTEEAAGPVQLITCPTSLSGQGVTVSVRGLGRTGLVIGRTSVL